MHYSSSLKFSFTKFYTTEIGTRTLQHFNYIYKLLQDITQLYGNYIKVLPVNREFMSQKIHTNYYDYETFHC